MTQSVIGKDKLFILLLKYNVMYFEAANGTVVSVLWHGSTCMPKSGCCGKFAQTHAYAHAPPPPPPPPPTHTHTHTHTSKTMGIVSS